MNSFLHSSLHVERLVVLDPVPGEERGPAGAHRPAGGGQPADGAQRLARRRAQRAQARRARRRGREVRLAGGRLKEKGRKRDAQKRDYIQVF